MNTMNEAGICIVVHNNYFTTRYALENLIEKTKIKHRLYIVDNSSEEKHLSDYCKQLCAKTGGYYKLLTDKHTYSQALNKMLSIVSQKYVVVFPINAIVQQNWLEDLIYYQNIIPTVGVNSIRSTFDTLHWMPLIHKCESMPEDELKNILITENNSIEGIMCFEKDRCYQIGLFDEKLQNAGFEQAEFCFRMASLGLNNIYIRKQTYVKAHLSDEMLFPKKTKEGMDEFKTNVDWMIKNQMFKK